MRRVVKAKESETVGTDALNTDNIYAVVSLGLVYIAVPTTFKGNTYILVPIGYGETTRGNCIRGAGSRDLRSILELFVSDPDSAVYEFDTALEFFEWGAEATA